ncbi:MAG TPA: hypothetical protein VFG76_10815, partial [Candidatus Polarisedimenticolia bacterium]|nr:hypothetical protein [Candidatus Polarisedimenticolia bacterium]
ISADGLTIAYAVCDETIHDGATSVVKLRNLVTGADTVAGSVRGVPRALILSGGADKILVAGVDETGPVPACVLDAHGASTCLEPGWTPLGWYGRDKVVLADGDREVRRIAVADAAGRDLSVVYP